MRSGCPAEVNSGDGGIDAPAPVPRVSTIPVVLVLAIPVLILLDNSKSSPRNINAKLMNMINASGAKFVGEFSVLPKLFTFSDRRTEVTAFVLLV